MDATTYTIEIMTTAGVLTAVPAGTDEAHARKLYKAVELTSGPSVECVSLESFTPSGEPWIEGAYRILASG